ncbi:helix-turn-helix domain-containing protein [Mammaliicoccus sciuri]|uniref:helix-turn-helix domain-containing protein n=1 Tax=Mammaliicoccus sciuri TaxID=1296 RepID=UPI002DBA16BA|nr:helix-turn-helix transcriptional regulator [Mammaliicoccus sciuri]MEB5757432.1 helix-turn-helix transcriptional regulator [Mammaliicoccus sciuri]
MISKEEQEYRLALGEALKRFRKRMGLTLGNVEEATGIKKQYLSMLELGKRPINEKLLQILSTTYRAKPSLIIQSAYDHIDLKEFQDINKLLKCEFDLDGAHLKVESKIKNQHKLYRIPENIMQQILSDFNI